jgi:hypothetical protein
VSEKITGIPYEFNKLLQVWNFLNVLMYV